MERVTKKELKELETLLTKDDVGLSLYYCIDDNSIYIWQGDPFASLNFNKGK